MNSLPTIEQMNTNTYYEVLSTFDPELYLIKIALEETRVNPALIPPVIRAISNLAIGSGYGRVNIYMQEKRITSIDGEERSKIELSAVGDEV